MTWTVDPEAAAGLRQRLAGLRAQLERLPAVQAGEIDPGPKLAALVLALDEPITRTLAALPPLDPARLPVIAPRQRRPGAGRRPNHAREILASDIARAMEGCGLPVERTHGAGIEDASLYFQVLHVVFGIAFPAGSAGAEPETSTSANYGRLVTVPRRWKIAPSCDATTDELRQHGIAVRPPGQLKP